MNSFFLVSLTTRDNDYQQEQAMHAERAARQLGATVKVIYSENDTITQSEQLLDAIQTKDERPAGIIFEPVGGTGLPQVAKAAAAAHIGWGVLNRDVEYISELRRATAAPVFE